MVIPCLSSFKPSLRNPYFSTMADFSASASSLTPPPPPQRLQKLCEVSKSACDCLTPMVRAFYGAVNVPNTESSKLKADASVFTIADGIVQHLLVKYLFAGDKFSNVVGEEDEDDDHVNITSAPFRVGDLVVPDIFLDLITSVRDNIASLAIQIENDTYRDVTIFIDPIDGTREFSTNLGEQCSICIGFSDAAGLPIAGLVYRPITEEPTWAAGAVSESYRDGHLAMCTSPPSTEVLIKQKGLLTSNGGISKFLEVFMSESGYMRVPSGGAGNKMLMLLEGKGDAYIQDRGVSRWDTSGAQAVLNAYGGTLSKLTSIVDRQELTSYKYLKSDVNLDFEPSRAALTAYNVMDKALVVKGAPTVLAEDVLIVKPYSNLCGLFALSAVGLEDKAAIIASVQRAAAKVSPAYD